MRAPGVSSDAGPVAIICGGGTFPFTVADALIKSGRATSNATSPASSHVRKRSLALTTGATATERVRRWTAVLLRAGGIRHGWPGSLGLLFLVQLFRHPAPYHDAQIN